MKEGWRRPKVNARALGLTLSDAEAEMVLLRQLGDGRWVLDDHQKTALPPGIFDGEGLLQDPGGLTEVLRDLFPAASRFDPPVHVSFDGPQVLVRGNSLKDIPWSSHHEYLMTQIRRYPNFKQGELAVGYHGVNRGEGEAGEDGTESEVLVLATRQEVLQGLQRSLQELGLEMGLGTSRALAAFGVPLRVDEALAGRNELWLAVTTVPSKLVISLWQGRQFLFYREIPLVKEERAVASTPPETRSGRGGRRGRPESRSPQEDLAGELIMEIRRSLGFYQVADPAAVTICLIDFPDAGELRDQIQQQDAALRVIAYRLPDGAALELGGREPSAAALGTAMLVGDSGSVIDLSFVRPRGGVRRALGTLPAALGAGLLLGGLLVGAALLARLALIEPWIQQVREADERVTGQLARIEERTKAQGSSLPSEEVRRGIQATLERNRKQFEVLAQFMDRDLPRLVPSRTWLDTFSLEEQSRVNLDGRTSDPQAAVEFARRLKQTTYMADVRLLVIDREPGESGLYRYRIVGRFSAPRSTPG